MLHRILLTMALQSTPVLAVIEPPSTTEICVKWLTKKAPIIPGMPREVMATVVTADQRYIQSFSGFAVLIGDLRIQSGSHLLYYYPLELETFRRDPRRLQVVDEHEIHHVIVKKEDYDRYMDALIEERKGSIQATIDLSVEKSGRYYTISYQKFKEL